MHNLSICAIIKDEDQYLEEWVSYHLALGVDHIYLYDNNSINHQQNFISEANLAHVTVIPYPKRDGNPQNACYNQFLKDYGHESKWVAIIDADEFIRVVDDTPLLEFLEEFEDYDGLYVAWVTYNADGQLTNDGRPVRERFLKTVPNAEGVNGKSIIRPDKVSVMDTHFPESDTWDDCVIVDERHERVYEALGYIAPDNRIVIDHYFTKSWEEWQHKINRGTADNSGVRKMRDFFYFNPELVDYAPDEIKDILDINTPIFILKQKEV